jgi:uncharacterized protein YacL
MSEKLIRYIFVFSCLIMGVIWGGFAHQFANPESTLSGSPMPWYIIGGFLGGAAGLSVALSLRFITQEVYEKIAPATVAIVIGILFGYAVASWLLLWIPGTNPNFRIYIIVTFVLIFGFMGIFLGLKFGSSWQALLSAVERHKSNTNTLKLVDTSVIIDGRISDICDSGFIEGTLMVPRFVLLELQHIADSSDVLRRAKGRRGLDILKELQRDSSRVDVEVIEDDPQDVREVDSKLVRLAQKYSAKILTNDFNLNKVAQIEGIIVLNINDLANALKPAVLPDEQMEVKIIKEGKEATQGVGYLDDGTMVVVDGGRVHMGKMVQVIVTSVLQTAAGRMIFTRFDNVMS